MGHIRTTTILRDEVFGVVDYKNIGKHFCIASFLRFVVNFPDMTLKPPFLSNFVRKSLENSLYLANHNT